MQAEKETFYFILLLIKKEEEMHVDWSGRVGRDGTGRDGTGRDGTDLSVMVVYCTVGKIAS